MHMHPPEDKHLWISPIDLFSLPVKPGFCMQNILIHGQAQPHLILHLEVEPVVWKSVVLENVHIATCNPIAGCFKLFLPNYPSRNPHLQLTVVSDPQDPSIVRISSDLP